MQATDFAAVVKQPEKMPGYFERSQFTKTDADTITVGAGCYVVKGTSETKLIQIESDTTYDFTGLTASTWRCLYLGLDGLLSEGGSPTWSDAKQAWYDGEKRCIFAVYGDGSGDIEHFEHRNDGFFWVTHNLRASSNLSTAGEMITATVPVFSRVAIIHAESYSGTSVNQYINVGMSSSTLMTKRLRTRASANATMSECWDQPLDGSGQFFAVKVGSGQLDILFNQDGFYLGRGI